VSDESSSGKPPPIVVSCDKDGRLTVDGEPVAKEDLVAVIKRKQEESREKIRNSVEVVQGLDHRQFNVQDPAGVYLCPACGWPGYFVGDSYDERSGVIGTGICPCCLFEPGFDDNPAASAGAEVTVAASITKYRSEWVAAGMPWRGTQVDAPTSWDAQAQLRHLIEAFPKL
jgi:hypothetical protein